MVLFLYWPGKSHLYAASGPNHIVRVPPSRMVEPTGATAVAEGGAQSTSSAPAEPPHSVDEKTVAVREALFLLQTEVPFFLKNIQRVMEEILSYFPHSEAFPKTETPERQQHVTGNVIFEEGGAPNISGFANVQGARIVSATIIASLGSSKKPVVKSEISQSKPWILHQLIAVRNFSRRALQGVKHWAYVANRFQEAPSENLTHEDADEQLFFSRVWMDELSREIHFARINLVKTGDDRLPDVEYLTRFSPPLPKQIIFKFDILDADLHVTMYVLRAKEGAAAESLKQRFRKAPPSIEGNFSSLHQKNIFLAGKKIEHGGEEYEIIDQYNGRYTLPEMKVVSSLLDSVHRECNFLAEKIRCHQTIFYSLGIGAIEIGEKPNHDRSASTTNTNA